MAKYHITPEGPVRCPSMRKCRYLKEEHIKSYPLLDAHDAWEAASVGKRVRINNETALYRAAKLFENEGEASRSSGNVADLGAALRQYVKKWNEEFPGEYGKYIHVVHDFSLDINGDKIPCHLERIPLDGRRYEGCIPVHEIWIGEGKEQRGIRIRWNEDMANYPPGYIELGFQLRDFYRRRGEDYDTATKLAKIKTEEVLGYLATIESYSHIDGFYRVASTAKMLERTEEYGFFNSSCLDIEDVSNFFFLRDLYGDFTKDAQFQVWGRGNKNWGGTLGVIRWDNHQWTLDLPDGRRITFSNDDDFYENAPQHARQWMGDEEFARQFDKIMLINHLFRLLENVQMPLYKPHMVNSGYAPEVEEEPYDEAKRYVRDLKLTPRQRKSFWK
ncbi:hypothetical protein BSR29_04915 [Boudabousia liubingyangii]|uniref:Uncharacterized protein n=1 Tax=Boudabousia liubingyangii TaxID=1921764 RepID=A0A1Q5PLE5_9ACTO|nr:hypothetical protein [Boudabousia liubingyangii]OKL47837.1 hypothetical protein BSR29_04915 [Boudabousia liubingyangii]